MKYVDPPYTYLWERLAGLLPEVQYAQLRADFAKQSKHYAKARAVLVAKQRLHLARHAVRPSADLIALREQRLAQAEQKLAEFEAKERVRE